MSIYNEETLQRLTDRIDEVMASEGGFKLWRKLSSIFERASKEVLGEAVELEEIIETWKREASRRSIHVNRVHFSADGGPFPDNMAGKDGYELLFENVDGSYTWAVLADCVFMRGNNYIPDVLVEEMLMLARQGYRLVEPEIKERKIIGKGDLQ